MMDRRYADFGAAVAGEMMCVVQYEGERDSDHRATTAVSTRETGHAKALAADHGNI